MKAKLQIFNPSTGAPTKAGEQELLAQRREVVAEVFHNYRAFIKKYAQRLEREHGTKLRLTSDDFESELVARIAKAGIKQGAFDANAGFKQSTAVFRIIKWATADILNNNFRRSAIRAANFSSLSGPDEQPFDPVDYRNVKVSHEGDTASVKILKLANLPELKLSDREKAYIKLLIQANSNLDLVESKQQRSWIAAELGISLAGLSTLHKRMLRKIKAYNLSTGTSSKLHIYNSKIDTPQKLELLHELLQKADSLGLNEHAQRYLRARIEISKMGERGHIEKEVEAASGLTVHQVSRARRNISKAVLALDQQSQRRVA